MSLIRPTFLEDLQEPRLVASPRLRGLKGFDPQDIPAFQDPLYADDPTFWWVANDQAGAALNLGHLGIQTPADDSMVVTVDGVLASGPAADMFAVDCVVGGALLLVLATDTVVLKQNRREQARATGAERTGLLRIVDNTNAFAATTVRLARAPAQTTVYIPVGLRLFGNEQCFVRNTTVNQGLSASMWGRLTAKGQR